MEQEKPGQRVGLFVAVFLEKRDRYELVVFLWWLLRFYFVGSVPATMGQHAASKAPGCYCSCFHGAVFLRHDLGHLVHVHRTG